MQSHNTKDSTTLQYKHINKHKLGFKAFDGIILYFKQSKNCGCNDKSVQDKEIFIYFHLGIFI